MSPHCIPKDLSINISTSSFNDCFQNDYRQRRLVFIIEDQHEGNNNYYIAPPAADNG